MAHPARYRTASPGSKRLANPMRASTGTVQAGSYEPYESHSAARYGHENYPSDAAYSGRYGSRTRAEPLLEAQPISTKTYRDPGHSTRHRTEYAIRPRSRSHTASSDLHNNPPRIVAPRSPSNRPSPVVTTYGRAPSPRSSHTRRDDTEKYLTPASSTHGRRHSRVYSTDYASDTGRLNPYDRAGQSQMGYGEYRAYGPRPHRRYAPVGGYGKGDGFNDDEAYSYTNPREQFEKESVARLKHQQAGRRQERPVSIAGPEGMYLAVPRPDGRLTHGPPPPSHRDFGRAGGNGSSSRHYDEFLSSRHRDGHRASVDLHHGRDDGYSSYTDDNGGGRRHHRHHRHHGDESTRHRHDDPHSRKYTGGDGAAPAAAAAAGLGTAVLASGYSDESLDYKQAPRHDRHRSRDLDGTETYSSQGYLEPKDAERRRRSGRSSRRHDENESHPSSTDEDPRHARRERSSRRPHGESDSTSSTENGRRRRLEAGDPAGVRKTTAPKARDSAGSPPTEVRDKVSSSVVQDSSKKPITVEPAPAKESESPPKGILKPPREKFPEEPNAVREGVAPLKDAQKQGIPSGARWTKIDRRLVNPAALEAAHERFEERPEYVIVLRVLTKEEIQAFAVMTQEIRDARNRQYLEEKRRRREEHQRAGRPFDEFSSDDEDEDDETPLAIEGPPQSSKTAASIRS